MELDLLFLKKTPPNSPEAERAVLGGILVNNKSLNVVLSIIQPEDFYKEAHRKIIARISDMIDRGLPVELLSLSEDLRRRGELEDVGGAAYLSSLMDGVPRNLSVEYYARIIKEKALLRRLIISSAETISRSYEEKDEPDEILDQAQTAIVNISDERSRQGFVPLSQITAPTMKIIEEFAARKEAVTGVDTGFTDLNRLTAGFHKDELVIVAARPSMGKTAICLNIAEHVGLKSQMSVGFFSMEMSKESLVMRLLASDANIDGKSIRTGFVSDRDLERLKLSAARLEKAKIFLDETPALTLLEMKAKSRRLRLEHNLDIVFVDYIQLMRAGGRFENRNQEMSHISRSLKELAKELHVPVVGISQLSRAPEKARREPRPQLSDLRESGAIEQDADVVIFIYRPEVYLSPEERQTQVEKLGVAEIIVAKQRNGPIGTIRLAFQDKFAKFADMAFGGSDYVS